MEVRLYANILEVATESIADILQDVFPNIEKDVSKNYGGTIQNLWISFELRRFGIDRRPPFPFQFQKKVGGSVFKLTGLMMPVWENVGSYSVRPDFDKLLHIPLDTVAPYALKLIYDSTSILIEKKKKTWRI